MTSPLTIVLISGASGWAAVRLRRTRARHRLRARVHAPSPGAAAPVRRVAPALLALAGVGLVLVWRVVGPAAVSVLVAMVLGALALSRRSHQAAQRRRRQLQLPAALDRLAASLRTGASLTMALDEVGAAMDPPIGPELTGLARAAARGRPLADVLDDWSSSHEDTGTRLASSALVLATVVGSAPARALDGVAATVRERLDLAAERRALATQARTSSLVLSVAPVGVAALLVVGDSAAARFLLSTPPGLVCLAAGLGLDAAGAWWMARLSRSDDW